ncbi:MAG: BrnA antitoxin family protein [Sphingomonas sp.]
MSISDGIDPDDAPELMGALAEAAGRRIGGKVVRPAADYLGPKGVVRGRPPLRGTAKRQVTLRLDPDVIEKFREGGPGWQVRMNEALRKAVGLT